MELIQPISSQVKLLWKGNKVTLSDFRIAFVFGSVIALTVLIGSVFGIKGIYFILSFHTLVNAFLITLSLIANGKI